MNIECEESFTPRDVYLSFLQAHRFFLNSEPLTRETLSEPISTHISKTMNQTQDRIKLLEHQYRKTDQFIISNEHLLEAKQNEMQLEDLPHGDRSHGKLQKQRSRSLILAKAIEITVEENYELI